MPNIKDASLPFPLSILQYKNLYIIFSEKQPVQTLGEILRDKALRFKKIKIRMAGVMPWASDNGSQP